MAGTGKLIALECIDETVLDTQVQRLYRWLNARGTPVERTAEPTCGPVGAQILLCRRGRLRIDPLSLALYDVADRMDHLGRQDGMLAWLEAGRTVLCARYVAYSMAWHFGQVDLEWLLQINTRCRVPDLTLFLDVAPDEAAAGLENGYRAVLDVLHAGGHNVVIVNGRDTGQQLFEHCCRQIDAL